MEKNENLRVIYDTFLDSGELIEIMPEASGIWDKDKILFESTYLSLNNDTDFDDEVEEYFDEYSFPL